MEKRQLMNGETDSPVAPHFAFFMLGLEQKYNISLDDVLEAVSKFGFSKSKILGYFEVQSYLNNKGLLQENVNAGMIHRWFPA